MIKMNYKWELSGEMDRFLDLEKPIRIEREDVSVEFVPVTRNGKKFIDFHIRTKTEDKSVEKAMLKCRRIFYRILDMYAFLQTQGVKARFNPITLLNENELAEREMELPEDREFIVPTIEYEPKPGNLDKQMRLYERIESHKKGKDLFRCISWFARSLKADDEVDKFISLWISFNILYEMYYHRGRGERPTQLHFINNVVDLYDDEFKKNLLEDEKNSELIRDLIEYGSFGGGEDKIRCAYELDKNLGKDHDAAFENFLLCIYRIRCDLFHGDKPIFQLYPLVGECNRVLIDITKNGIMMYLENH